MKICPICKTKYADDANFCPLETCASADGPQRLEVFPEEPEPRFKPIERIGGGNTGEIWRARDNQTGTDVALKLVNPEIAGSAANQSRVEREFKQLMRVASPRVASIIDCGRMPDQRLFVAMELFPGESLVNVLRSGPVDLDTAKNIIGQVGQALLEAQKAGLVHRDVSPKNVLMGPNGDVKVINFPLAKPVTDKVVGEPAYLSPEQAQGKPADQRSNTYSLAAILYHLLTGEPPFQSSSVQAVLDMHVSSPVLPPSQRRPDAQISPEADRLMLKALDKTSSRRHLTLRLFLTELEAVKTAVAGQPAGSAKGGDVGMAKTMLFAGKQSDVARMVADAMAARNAAAAAAPAPAQPAAPAHAKPQAAVSPISVMATLAADSLPSAAHGAPAAAQPAPQAPVRSAPQAAAPKAQAPAAKAEPAGPPATASGPMGGGIKPAQAGAAPPPKAGAAFRETLWFKKGDVEQLVADAKAKLAAGGKPQTEGELPTEDVRPLEDRYVDDGSVTTEDRKKFSLRTGGTATALPAAAAAIPGEHMSESDIVQEIGHGRRTAILLVVIALVVIAAVVVIMSMRGGQKGEKKVGVGHTFPPSAAALSGPAPAPTPAPAPKSEPPPSPAAAAAVVPAAPAGNPAIATATPTGTAVPAAVPPTEKAAKPAPEERAKTKAAGPAAADDGGKKAGKAKPAPHKGKRKH